MVNTEPAEKVDALFSIVIEVIAAVLRHKCAAAVIPVLALEPLDNVVLLVVLFE
jgi:hypothetical protein